MLTQSRDRLDLMGFVGGWNCWKESFEVECLRRRRTFVWRKWQGSNFYSGGKVGLVGVTRRLHSYRAHQKV
jgi:hypothetical protein